jgi:hypothetical protein
MQALKHPSLEYGVMTVRQVQKIFNAGCDLTIDNLNKLPNEESKEADPA